MSEIDVGEQPDLRSAEQDSTVGDDVQNDDGNIMANEDREPDPASESSQLSDAPDAADDESEAAAASKNTGPLRAGQQAQRIPRGTGAKTSAYGRRNIRLVRVFHACEACSECWTLWNVAGRTGTGSHAHASTTLPPVGKSKHRVSCNEATLRMSLHEHAR